MLGSSYAKVGGVPVALLGALAYFCVFAFATFAAFGYARAPKFLTLTVGAMFLADALAAVCAGLPAACVLPILFVLSGNHISYCRAADRRAALTTPVWRMSRMLV